MDPILQSIELLTTETRCMAGQTYYLGYNTTPSDTLLYDRTDIRAFVEVDDPNELIQSYRLERPYTANPYVYPPKIVFKENVTGQVGVRLCVEDLDSGDIIRSNTLELNVYNDKNIVCQGTSGSNAKKFNAPNILNMTVGSGTIDTTQYLVASGTQSRYFYLAVTNSASGKVVWVGTDGTTIIPVSAGSAEITVMTHEAYANNASGTTLYGGSYTKLSSWKRLKIEVIDEAEALGVGNAMNLRFKVNEVIVDRSTDIFPSVFHDDPKDYPGVYRDENGDLNRWLYLNQTYDFHPRDYKDFVEYDDPNEVIDLSRLEVRLENNEGQPVLFMGDGRAGADVATEWAEGSCWLVARYGSLSSTKEATYCRIPYTNITSNPNHIPVRYVYEGHLRTDGDTLDYSTWYPASKVIKVVPKDAVSTGGFGLTGGDEVYYTERIGNTGTLDDQFKVRLAGIGKYSIGTAFSGNGVHSGGTLEIRWGGMSASYPSGHYEPNDITMIPSKTSIKKGEYVVVNVQYTPDYDFTLYAHNFATKGWRYKIDGGEWLTKDKANKTGIIEVVCESRKGSIFKNLEGNHVVSASCCVYWGAAWTGEDFHTDITLLSTEMSGTFTPTINAATKNGFLVDNQTLTLSGGTVAGWNSSSWRYASIQKTGLLRTYSPGEVTIYAVTTDGRLAQSIYRVGSSSGSVTPIEPEPETPIDTTPREAQDITDDVVLEFSDKSDITFDSPASSPTVREITRLTHNFDLRDVVCTSENPGVATIQGSYNMNTGTLSATITPVGKGDTVVRVVCGAESDSLNVSVLDGTDATTPHITYKDMTGASLNIYEYTRISFTCDSSEIFQELSITGNKEGIEVSDPTYNDSTHAGSFKVTLTDHVSGYVYVDYGQERLKFSIANRFNLKFENIQDFRLGIGATRKVMIYPLDDTIKASSVWVHAQNSSNPAVYIDDIVEGTDNNGKRVFFVSVTYRREGQEVLIASRKGDDDIYLDLECEATSIPAQSISFNQNSITINK